MKRKKMDEPNEEMEREHMRGSFKKMGGRHMKRKMRRKSKRY